MAKKHTKNGASSPGGSIYRAKAIRQIGGLYCCIKGALEDFDAEYRMGEMVGWLISLKMPAFKIGARRH
jgi:hypothetical protein